VKEIHSFRITIPSNPNTIEFVVPQIPEPELDNEDEEFLTSTEAYAKNKQVCKYIHCQQESYNGKYYNSIITENLVICKACEEYEFKFGALKRTNKTEKKKPSNGVCQYIHCQKESSNGKWYKSKTSTNMVICQACAAYERKYGTLKQKIGHQTRKKTHPISISATSDASDINFLNFKPFPESSSDSADEESSNIEFDNHETTQKEFQIFHLDDEVDCRSDDNDVWFPDRVTKLVPLEVQPNEWDYSRQWDDVCKREIGNRVSKQKYSSNPVCEYCKEQSSKPYLSQSQTSESQLCAACYRYEKKYGKLVPRNQRGLHRNQKFKIKSTKVCEYCKEHSSQPYLSQSKTSEFQLCAACKRYENNHGKLVPRYQRKLGRPRKIKSKKPPETHIVANYPINTSPGMQVHNIPGMQVHNIPGSSTDINQTFCSVCGSGGDESAFLLCEHEDEKMHGAHYYCMGLSVLPSEDEAWFCSKHTKKKKTPIILEPEEEPLRKYNTVVEKICQLCHQETPNTYSYTRSNVQQNLCEACYQSCYQMTWQISTKRNRETNNTTATDLRRKKKKQKIESIFMRESNIQSTISMEPINVPLPPLEKETSIDRDAKESHANFEESNHSFSATSEQSSVLQRPLAILTQKLQENYYTCHTCSKRALKLYQLKPCDHLMCPQCAFQGLQTQCPSCGKKANNCIKINIS